MREEGSEGPTWQRGCTRGRLSKRLRTKRKACSSCESACCRRRAATASCPNASWLTTSLSLAACKQEQLERITRSRAAQRSAWTAKLQWGVKAIAANGASTVICVSRKGPVLPSGVFSGGLAPVRTCRARREVKQAARQRHAIPTEMDSGRDLILYMQSRLL